MTPNILLIAINSHAHTSMKYEVTLIHSDSSEKRNTRLIRRKVKSDKKKLFSPKIKLEWYSNDSKLEVKIMYRS